MNTKKKKLKWKRSDFVGVGCGVLAVLLIAGNAVAAKMPSTAGVPDSEIPASAQTLTGVAPGRNGDITVEVVATEDQIYRIKVIDHKETESIGTPAIQQLPVAIFQNQSLSVDSVAGATITSDGIRAAVLDALSQGNVEPARFGAALVKAETIAKKVETKSGVSVTYAKNWADEYPEVYASWQKNSEVSETTDYLVDYPMLKTLYEPYGFSKDYKSARGHSYTLQDVRSTERIGANSKASCWTCKTPDFTNMVNTEGETVYALPFSQINSRMTEAVSCFNCHANTPGEVTVTHTYLIDAVGDDFERIDASDLACGQCHVEYYFDPETNATTLPYGDHASMSPDAILAYFNNGANFPNGKPFTDYTNPRTGVQQIKVQHPELETYLGEGSQHRSKYSCADCHMGEAFTDDGVSYTSHYLSSPLKNEELLEGECASCHTDLVSEIQTLQADVERRTYAIGYELEYLTERLALAVESGEYSTGELNAIRALARDAQFYWDFVFVENSEGAHNSKLTHECLDKAEALCNEALGLFKR